MKKKCCIKCLKLYKKVLSIVLISTVNSLKYISMKNQECKEIEVIINNEYMVYPCSIKVNRCNNISNPYSSVCIPNITKNVTVKIFDLMTLKNKQNK